VTYLSTSTAPTSDSLLWPEEPEVAPYMMDHRRVQVWIHHFTSLELFQIATRDFLSSSPELRAKRRKYKLPTIIPLADRVVCFMRFLSVDQKEHSKCERILRECYHTEQQNFHENKKLKIMYDERRQCQNSAYETLWELTVKSNSLYSLMTNQIEFKGSGSCERFMVCLNSVVAVTGWVDCTKEQLQGQLQGFSRYFVHYGLLVLRVQNWSKDPFVINCSFHRKDYEEFDYEADTRSLYVLGAQHNSEVNGLTHLVRIFEYYDHDESCHLWLPVVQDAVPRHQFMATLECPISQNVQDATVQLELIMFMRCQQE